MGERLVNHRYGFTRYIGCKRSFRVFVTPSAEKKGQWRSLKLPKIRKTHISPLRRYPRVNLQIATRGETTLPYRSCQRATEPSGCVGNNGVEWVRKTGCASGAVKSDGAIDFATSDDVRPILCGYLENDALRVLGVQRSL